MSLIVVEHLSKSYVDDTPVLEDINLSINKGEFIVFVGASGCGKTTLLKTINKLIPLSNGTIYFEGKKLSDWDTIELRRNIGYVIQQIGLFPHMTIEENITFVPNISGVGASDRRTKAEELIELVGLSISDLEKYPSEISGGQAQRIGVARALAANPDVILMDEPFGAVDEITRRKLQLEMKNIHSTLKKTILFVTHDIGEAIRLADRIVLLHEGKIEQIGTPKEMIFEPKTEFVKEFFGVKGFKETIKEETLNSLYQNVLNGTKSIDSLFD